MAESSRLEVLLIERDPLVREGMEALLRAWNFDVVAAAEPPPAAQASGPLASPRFVIVAAPLGNVGVGTAWVNQVHAAYGRLPTILVAERPADGAAPANREWLHVDWPIKTNRLRDAIAAIVRTHMAKQ